MAIVGFKNLCAPAMFYLVVSLITIGIIATQNFGSERMYCLGYYSCPVSSVYLIFIIKLIYVVFWTWILNLICRAGVPIISWLLVLIPILLFFVLIGLLLIHI